MRRVVEVGLILLGLGVLVACADTARGQAPVTTPGQAICVLRPETILNRPQTRQVIIWERLFKGYPQPVEARWYIGSISHIDEPAFRAATAAAAIQYSIALDPTGTLADTRIAAWVPDAPPTTLGQVVRTYLISGSWAQRNQAAARLVAAMASPVNDACNGGR